MKMKYFLEALPLMAALLLTASCSDKTDEISKTEPAPKGIPYTVTVNTDASTRATIGESGGVKKYLFETNDALHVQNSDGTVYGTLLISNADAGKNTGATFSGTIYGSPTDETVLNATLVSLNNQVVTFDGDGKGKVTGYNYLSSAIGSNIEEATQKFSVFTGSSTYGSKTFSLSQQSAFLCFDITLTDGTATGASLVAKVNNGGSEVRSATIETVTEGGKVKAKFVAAFPTSATYGGTTTLSGATVQLGSKAPISFGGSTALARNNYYQVAKEYTSLVQHWPFDGDAKNAVSGGVDAIVSGATLTTDRNGTANSAYYFDGIDDKMTASGAAEFGKSSFTANLWVCSTQSSGYGNLLRTDDGYSGSNGWLVRFNSGKLEIWEGRTVGRQYVSTNTYSDGVWHMVTYVRDVENHVGQLYVDGSYVGGYADTDNNVTGPLKFGTYGSGEYYKGKMDDVSLYNRALSASEVAELYPAASSRTLSAVTSSEVGWRIGSDGNAYSPVGALPAGVTAVAMIAYVGASGSADASSSTYKGLAIALADESNSYCNYGVQESAGVSRSTTMTDHKTILTGIADTQTLTTKYVDRAANKAANYSVAGFNPTTYGCSNWFLPSSGQWLKFFKAAGVNVDGLSNWSEWTPGGSDDWNKINALLTTAAGNSFNKFEYYWSSTEYDNHDAVIVCFSPSSGMFVTNYNKNYSTGNAYVRAFFAF